MYPLKPRKRHQNMSEEKQTRRDLPPPAPPLPPAGTTMTFTACKTTWLYYTTSTARKTAGGSNRWADHQFGNRSPFVSAPAATTSPPHRLPEAIEIRRARPPKTGNSSSALRIAVFKAGCREACACRPLLSICRARPATAPARSPEGPRSTEEVAWSEDQPNASGKVARREQLDPVTIRVTDKGKFYLAILRRCKTKLDTQHPQSARKGASRSGTQTDIAQKKPLGLVHCRCGN